MKEAIMKALDKFKNVGANREVFCGCEESFANGSNLKQHS